MIAQQTSSTRVRVALLGCGTVGREVAAQLLAHADELGIELVGILVRNAARDRGLPRELFTERFEDIAAARPAVAIELLGGTDPAAAHAAELLKHGVHLVTANKTLIARHGAELERIARRAGAGIAYEASVCAGIPLLASLSQLRGDHVVAFRGVVNGSCNFILTRLGAGLSFEAALAEARQKGLVEPDPSADISGRDSAEKLAVVAAAAGLGHIDPDSIACEGIDHIQPEDIVAARRGGHAIKLLAEFGPGPDGPRLRVGPTLIPRSHPLAGVSDEENGVVITTELCGDILLRGKGAGPRPTASAILGDLRRLVEQCRNSNGAGTDRAGRLHQPSAGVGPSPETRHHVRISRPRFNSPERLFAELRRHGVEPEETDLTRVAARFTARGACRHRLGEVAASLTTAADERGVLIMPVIAD